MTHITLPRATVEQALEALLKSHTCPLLPDDCEEAITALKAALAQQAEPVEPPKPAPLKRGITGRCTRKVCECEKEGLGLECIHLEPVIDGYPLWSGIPKAEPVEPVAKMTAHRAVYFMERFKREEKMLGPNEQAALDFVISMLEAALADPQSTHSAECYQWHHKCAIAEVERLRAALAQQAEQAEPVTIERLRDALVASRIIPPAAVEDPDEYDDGVTLFRIEALHRRIT